MAHRRPAARALPMQAPQASRMETYQTSSLEQTHRLGRRIAGRLGAGDCVALTGPLGAGKTALVRGLAVGLGLTDERLVTSPTYVLVQEYPGKVNIYHVDLYRLAQPAEELAGLGLAEMLADGVVIIEWADRAADALPTSRLAIDIEITGPDTRRFTLRRLG